jgi:two-component system, NarL family, invasion response regulator UvrY
VRALVVDDHGLTRKYLREILLEDCGIDEVDEASDGDAALALIMAGRYDLVILDIDMPGKDGLSVLAELGPKGLEMAGELDCAFLVFSALAEKDYADRALRLGATGYLSKGCPPDKITEAVKAALGRKSPIKD